VPDVPGAEDHGADSESAAATGKPPAVHGEAPTTGSDGPPRGERSAAAQSTTDAGYQVALPVFEGPLDLLLHLVRKHELDILDIPIAFITEKYTQYIRLLDELNIDVASEYLVMAATLVHIKSRVLLPNAPDDDQEELLDDSDLDPRAELVRRLLEYQKYKGVAEELAERSILGRDVFPRGSSEELATGPAPLSGVNMFKLLDAFQGVLERTKQTREHEIDFERFSISEKISEISDRLRANPRLIFHEIFGDDASRAELIITFLAILEMTKLRMTRISQDGPLAAIYIELTVSDDEFTEPSEDGPTDYRSIGNQREYE
jgi:segregation and condensation protein A